MSMIARLIDKQLPPEVLAVLDPDEASGAAEVSARADTYSVYVQNGADLIGYAVFGKDEGGIVAVYYARALVPVFGPMMMKQIFGAAAILGDPIRVHTEKVAAMARVMGAKVAIEATDVDGMPMGVFSDGQ